MSRFSKVELGREDFEVVSDGTTFNLDVEYVLRVEGENSSYDYPGDSRSTIEHLTVHHCCDLEGNNVAFTDDIERIVKQKIRGN